jgi:radical SAM protein with 4Fe4S-binding SPASM domain
LEAQDPKAVEGWKGIFNRYKDFEVDPETLYSCKAGVRSFHIDPYGNLSLCMTARQAGYNLRSGTFQEGWDKFLYQERYKPPSQGYSCQQCKLLSLCGQCPGWSYLEHGTEEKPVAYLCQVAHLRQKEYELTL